MSALRPGPFPNYGDRGGQHAVGLRCPERYCHHPDHLDDRNRASLHWPGHSVFRSNIPGLPPLAHLWHLPEPSQAGCRSAVQMVEDDALGPHQRQGAVPKGPTSRATRVAVDEVFLDSDDVNKLDAIIDVTAWDSQNVVVLMTQECLFFITSKP